MPKLSAGLLIYRQRSNKTEVLLVHPGGPFWVKKDDGAWDIPKGQVDQDEEDFAAAKREFKEEIGLDPPTSKPKALGEITIPSGKVVRIWAIKGDVDLTNFKSNLLKIRWLGKKFEFPEVDRAEWFDLGTARYKIQSAKVEFLNRFEKLLE